MKNYFALVLAFISLCHTIKAQSLSLQIGSSSTPNPFYWQYESTHKQALMGGVSLYYQPKIGKNIEFVTGLGLTYTQINYEYKPNYDCTVGMLKVPTYSQNSVQPLNTHLLLGTNILLCASPNKKWDFWLSPSIRLGGLSLIRLKSRIIYEDGSEEIFHYKSNFNESSIARYGSLGTQVGQETRFHFAEKFFASAKIWGGYEFTYLEGEGHNGIGYGLQVGVGYKWK